LGNALCTRFRRDGNLADVDASISIFRNALQYTSEDKSRVAILNNLGDALFARSQASNNKNNVEESINTFKQGVDLLPEGHKDRLPLLNGLGNALGHRFELSGRKDISDINDAINYLKGALSLLTHNTYRAPVLCNLGDALLTRFRYHWTLYDLEKALENLTEAVHVTKDQDRKQSRLNKLNVALAAARQFNLRDQKDNEIESYLNAWINAIQLSLHLTPDDRALQHDLKQAGQLRART
jgi:tetratricopeptide (TPR) repeat protein